MRAALAIIAVIIILVLFGTMMTGINAAKMDERDDAFLAVATAPGVVDADVVLVADPFENSILNIVTITSDNALDAPLPDAYVGATNTLTVRGLNDDDTRGLTVTYNYAALVGQAAPMGIFLDLMPFLIAVALVLIVVGAMVVAWVSRK